MLTQQLITFSRGYLGSKLAILATGGGMGLAQIATIPGASRVLHSFYSPYAVEETKRFVYDNNPPEGGEFMAVERKMVGLDAALELMRAVRYHTAKATKETVRAVAVTASCTTNRYRRGNNEAFIAIDGEGVWHLKLPKLTEEEFQRATWEEIILKRQHEDDTITLATLRLVSGLTLPLENETCDAELVRIYS